jgi:hypothetical protein
MARLRKALKGEILNKTYPGFPLFIDNRHTRIITADVWAYFKYVITDRLKKDHRIMANAFLEQSFEFYEAAKNPRLSTRPVLYYYASLNLAKVFLIIKHISLPPAVKHGLTDPKTNQRKSMHFSVQSVKFLPCKTDHSIIFPELVKALGHNIINNTTIKVISLMRQIPGIHRTFCTITGQSPCFLPIKQFSLVKSPKSEIIVRVILDKNNTDVPIVLKNIRSRNSFKNNFIQVKVEKEKEKEEIWFETAKKQGRGSKRFIAIKEHAKEISKAGIWGILTNNGWRYYLSCLRPSEIMPPLASIYATMFYLGSITRYKPYDFDKILAGRYSWLMSEFVRTQPAQFLYGIAGHVAGTDVVRPFAALDE